MSFIILIIQQLIQFNPFAASCMQNLSVMEMVEQRPNLSHHASARGAEAYRKSLQIITEHLDSLMDVDEEDKRRATLYKIVIKHLTGGATDQDIRLSLVKENLYKFFAINQLGLAKILTPFRPRA